MNRLTRCFLCLIIAALLLTGCWNRRELNEIAIALGVGIDKNDEGYKISVQVVNPGAVAPQQNASANTAPVITYTLSGATIFEAMRRITTISPRKIYLSHIRIIVVGEEAAREGLHTFVDLLSRDHELRTDFYLLVSRDMTAEKILKVITLLERIPVNKMYASLLSSSAAWASTQKVTLDQLIQDISSKGKSSVLPGINIVGNPKIGATQENVQRLDLHALLQLEDMAVFKDGKLTAWMNEAESKVFNFITGNVKSTVNNIPCKEGNLALEVLTNKSKLTADVRHGRPEGKVKMELDVNIGEIQCEIDVTQEADIRRIESEAEDMLEREIASLLEKAQQQFRSDIFGFGMALHRSSPEYWRRVKADWHQEHFPAMKTAVEVKVSVRGIGSITNPLSIPD